jgi:hypothetical protein
MALTESAYSRPRQVTRAINPTITNFLWGRAAGRCEFAGCNRPLWKSPVTHETVNIAQRAHIYSFSPDGPRGNQELSDEDLNGFENLLLVCYACHQKIDRDKDGARYSLELLQQMKAAHERRIEIAGGIAPNMSSHVVLYGANIDQHGSPLQFGTAAQALFPNRYPATDRPLVLGTKNSSFQDRDVSFWKTEAEQLRRMFRHQISERINEGEIEHFSIFALAPQPLLILFGTLLGELMDVDVFQHQREPQGWKWQSGVATAPLILQEPTSKSGGPALVLALSGTVTSERIESILGSTCAIWRVTIDSPNCEFVKSREQRSAFRTQIRPFLDRIKASHGQTTPLHIFPAVPVSLAVELGRIRMPKADMPWRIYDQVNDRGGFVTAISIASGA